MVVYHLSVKAVSRRTGRTAVAAAAYRSGERLTDERTATVHDYSRREGVASSHIVLPEGAEADWARDRERLWNEAEQAENRRNSYTAREIEVALPAELSAEQREHLTLDFAKYLADRYGVGVDIAIHEPGARGDQRNHHAHLLLTTRQIGSEGFGRKSELEWSDTQRANEGLVTRRAALRDLREDWQHFQNDALCRAGVHERVDSRSFADRMIDLVPSQHQGVAATHLARMGFEVDRQRLSDVAREHNARKLADHPAEILKTITSQQATFTRADVARALGGVIDDAQTFVGTLERAMQSPEVVELQAATTGPDGKSVEAIYSTREMVGIERQMADRAARLADTPGHTVSDTSREAAIHYKAHHAERQATLGEEQRAALVHVTGNSNLAAVVGVAGAGKSTMLDAAREAWEREGYQVIGVAPTATAARNMQQEAGIKSATLHSYVGTADYAGRWALGEEQLTRRHVVVLDEAGQIDARMMGKLLGHAERVGAKVVLVGDHEQLQSIGAGAAFRTIAERQGAASLTEVRRQREAWQREASVKFAAGETAAALSTYAQRGHVQMHDTDQAARARLVADYMAHSRDQSSETRLALTFRRTDARALNETVRSARKQVGELGDEQTYRVQLTGEAAQERVFAAGDRLIFKRNDKRLGVDNGDIGTVKRLSADRLVVELDRGGTVSFDPVAYRAFDHGYASTIDSKQGVTVDRVFAFVGEGWDRHRAYVGMTRHREEVTAYASRETYRSVDDLVARVSQARAKTSTLDFEAGAVAERARMVGRDVSQPDRDTLRDDRQRLGERGLEAPSPAPGPVRADDPAARARDYATRAEQLGRQLRSLREDQTTRRQRDGLKKDLQALGREMAADRQATAYLREHAIALGIERGHTLHDVARGHAPDRSLGRDGRER